MAVSTAAAVLGAIILISIVIPYFLPIVAFVLVVSCFQSCDRGRFSPLYALLQFYFVAAQFYRASAREIKRLDNLLRSSLYAHFGESLSGMATIRAYGETDNFLKVSEKYLDIENRAYYLTIVNQR